MFSWRFSLENNSIVLVSNLLRFWQTRKSSKSIILLWAVKLWSGFHSMKKSKVAQFVQCNLYANTSPLRLLFCICTYRISTFCPSPPCWGDLVITDYQRQDKRGLFRKGFLGQVGSKLKAKWPSAPTLPHGPKSGFACAPVHKNESHFSCLNPG